MASVDMPHVEVAPELDLDANVVAAACSVVTQEVLSQVAHNQGVRGCWQDCSVRRISFEKLSEGVLIRVEARPGPQSSWVPNVPKEYVFRYRVDQRFKRLHSVD